MREKSFYPKTAEDLILNPKDHPDAKIGDVVEIYLPEDDGVHLLLQITSFQEDKKGTKGTIIVQHILLISVIALTFLLNIFFLAL